MLQPHFVAIQKYKLVETGCCRSFVEKLNLTTNDFKYTY
jgi:hypothetical protein